MNPHPGLYELLIDRRLKSVLESLDSASLVAETEKLDAGESHGQLAQHLGKMISRVLAGFPQEERVRRQVELCNTLLRLLAEEDRKLSLDVQDGAELVSDGERLLAISARDPVIGPIRVDRPETPLGMSSLLTGASFDPSLASQLRKEIAAADRVDILCSFIKWSGIRILEDELVRLTCDRGRQLRVITTSYTGATDFRAVEFLRKLPNTDVRISYDTGRTRLHAKAYLFHRETGFGTAYIGSANISNPALSDGLEWTMKVSQYESIHLWEKIQATFETYWEDHRDFTTYADGDQNKLRDALMAERPGTAYGAEQFPFEIHPYPFQEEILEQLQAQRLIHGLYRNLIVAATGTGKTVMAAFDYLRLCQTLKEVDRHRPVRLLFIAHREEILKQARRCFQGVLRDPNFGELWIGSERPDQKDHLFASIQTLNSQQNWKRFPAEYFDYIVVDEVHHSPATSYRGILDYVKPRVLLGLTATPERTDGEDILRWFGGRISAEIRLPKAINAGLLSPFQYFGISDSVDLNQLAWKRGYVPSELENLYVNNRRIADERADIIIHAVKHRLLDAERACGLGFCVTVKHAEYMAERFRQNGIPAEALSSQSPRDLRSSVQKRLREREINFVFTVDLYNEGVDLPEVDTVLLLRPTESLTVFLQQLGRGLRRWEGKEYLTVLDFIGQAHRSFRFEARFRALISVDSGGVKEEILHDFPHLPLGCSVVLERKAQAYILANISQALRGTRAVILARIRDCAQEIRRTPSLAEFLNRWEMDLSDVYAKASWSRLCVEARISRDFHEEDEEAITRGFRRLAALDSAANLRLLLEFFCAGPTLEIPTPKLERLLLMAHFTVWGRTSELHTIGESLTRFRKNPTLFTELIDLLKYRLDTLKHLTYEPDLPFPCPLEAHASYSRDQILAGLGEWTLEQQREVREGVVALKHHPADAFFITLNKTEKDYSPTTLYEDYALSEELFHWQSQSTTSSDSPTGRRYVEHRERGRDILLFVRENQKLNGMTSPYVFLGAADYVSHSGSRPMSIVWRLRQPIPAWLLPAAVRMRAA